MRKKIYMLLLAFRLGKSDSFLVPKSSKKVLHRPNYSYLLQVKTKDGIDDKEMSIIEREVMESTRATLDLQRVTRTLFDDELKPTRVPLVGWKVALAAGSAGGVAAFLVLHNLIVSGTIGASIFLVANGDPLEEETVAGALARVVGRVTLQSVEASQPKVRAIARAAVRGEDEVVELKSRLFHLERENAELRLWKERRNAVDEALPTFSLGDLKEKARQNALVIGGSKAQLLMRLVEAEIIRLS